MARFFNLPPSPKPITRFSGPGEPADEWVPPTNVDYALGVRHSCDEWRTCNFRRASPAGRWHNLSQLHDNGRAGLGSFRADRYPPADVRRQAGRDLWARVSHRRERRYQPPHEDAVGPAARPFRRPARTNPTIPASRCPPQADMMLRQRPVQSTPVAMRPWPTPTSVMTNVYLRYATGYRRRFQRRSV